MVMRPPNGIFRDYYSTKKELLSREGDSGGNARSMNMYKIGTLVH